METKQALQFLAGRYQQIQEKELVAKRVQIVEYASRLETLAHKHAKAKPPKSAPLTIPAIFKRTYDENFISDYLAYLLDPQKNGIGVAPLKAFLDLCGIEHDETNLESVLVRREYPLENGRIDLLIECSDNFVVGIENKVFSPEGTSQTPHYARVMAKIFSDIPYHMVFLTRYGHKPLSKQFIPISYGMLYTALKGVSIGENVASKQVFFWNDFIEHLEVYFMSTAPKSFEFSEKAMLYIENQAMIHDIKTAFDREWDNAISYLESRFREQVTGGPWNTVFQTRYSWQQAYKSNWTTEGLFIHFEWWIPFSALTQGEISFMVDVEGKQASEALALFDNQYGQLEPFYHQKGVDYRPARRKNAIAFKKYKITQVIDQISAVLSESFEELRFLEASIDKVIASLSKSSLP